MSEEQGNAGQGGLGGSPPPVEGAAPEGAGGGGGGMVHAPPVAPAPPSPFAPPSGFSQQGYPQQGYAQQGYRPPAQRPIAGRRYGFLCSYCSSRLEAVESMAGQSGTCPTCGKSIVIPILDYRGRLIDPTSGQVIKQDPHPVHAYAAAGHKAPQIVGVDGTDERYIKCPRCQRNNALSSNNCLGCGLPFTMEGTVGDAVSGTNTWAVASLVLGIVSVPGFCMIAPPILAIIFGGIALRSTNQATGQTAGAGLAVAGLILGTIGLVLAVLLWTGHLIHP